MPNDFTFRLRSSDSLRDTFSDTPPEVKDFLRRGFSVLGKVSSEKYEKLIETAAANLEMSHLSTETPSEFASALGINEREASALMGAATLVTSTLTQRGELPEEFVSVAQEAGFIQPGDAPAALAFSQAVFRDRDALAVIVQRARVGVAVLPSFRRLMTTTDVRLSFTESRIDLAVPVSVMGLLTDSGKMIWFQLTKGQLEQLITQLEGVRRDLEAAEQWIERSSRGSAR